MVSMSKASHQASDCCLTQATIEDKIKWGGFCEIESEPVQALFNSLLRDFGVHGVQVREVVSLDDETLSALPAPIYGLVLLFKWYNDENDQQEQSCPDEIWFANQTVNNACASVALLNIVNNISSIHLGDNLTAFREFTQGLSPADKGDAVANFEFVRRAHNSFARKIDIQNADLFLQNEVQQVRKGKQNDTLKDTHDAAFHFVGFMPINGRLWKLDGLERQPLCLGTHGNEDWLHKTRPELEARMLQCQEGGLGFALLSLVQDPLLNICARLTQNIQTHIALESELDKLAKGWRLEHARDPVDGHMSRLEDLSALIDTLTMQQARGACTAIDCADLNSVETLLDARRGFMDNQASLRMDLYEHRQGLEEEEQQAKARRHDFGARMQGFARFVHEKSQS